MCNRTPKPGETWVFRRDVYKAPVYDDQGELLVQESFFQYVTENGRVVAVDHDGVRISAPGPVGSKALGWAMGWEPFLCLDEGEAQEQPTDDGDGVLEVEVASDEELLAELFARFSRYALGVAP